MGVYRTCGGADEIGLAPTGLKLNGSGRGPLAPRHPLRERMQYACACRSATASSEGAAPRLSTAQAWYLGTVFCAIMYGKTWALIEAAAWAWTRLASVSPSFLKACSALSYAVRIGAPAASSRTWAVQFHPHGGQFGSVWLPARTPHGAYVWWARRNQEKYPPEK